MQSKTFRLFISSTFKDFRQERELLQVKVFPRIKEYCAQRGYAFLPIDLRWGVSEEAQYDQKTLELCLNEVRACKIHVHPNFLIMIGDRYGWIPLPYTIEKEEFETLLALANTKQEKELLVEWYKLDLNQLPASYILKERNDKYKEPNIWSEVEKSLLIILQTAVKASSLDEEQKRKYFLSATEAEVEEGIIPYIKPTKFQKEEILAKDATLEKVDTQYIFGFFRDIDKTTQIENEFIEDDYEEAQEFKKRVANVLDAKNRLHVQTIQRDKESLEEEYLREFEAFIIKKLTDAIDKQIKEKADISPLEQERLEQQQFKKLKIDTFFGRENELEIMQNYIKEIRTQPFMIYGISGIGKSSFLAKVIDTLERTLNQPLVYRFIGSTASSSNARQLLESIIIDLAEKKILSLPNKFEVDCNKFDEQVKRLLESISEPTIIVIDALDQLQNKDFLQWLPIKLPENLKIILSVLDEQDTQHYYALLQRKLATNNQLKLEPIHEDVAMKILDKLFHKEERCLTSKQHTYLLKQFTKSKSSPLYLIFAFQETKTWKSTENNISLEIGIQNIIKQFIDNLTKKFHHDKLVVHKVLGLIAASKDGLSESEIMDLLSKDENILSKLETHNSLGDKAIRRFPSSVWVRLSNQLKPFLSERFIDGQNLITFFHNQVYLAVKNYIYEPNKVVFHTELADYFLTLQDKNKLWDKRYYNLHMLSESFFQLYKARDNKRLKELLFDLEFVGSLYDNLKQNILKEIFEKAVEINAITKDEIYPWESFFREKNHFITSLNERNWKPHQTLFQLAYEDGSNSLLTLKAIEYLKNGKVDFLWLKNRNRPEKFRRSGLIKVLQEHTDCVKNVVVLNNKRLLSYADDNTLRLWSDTGKVLAVLRGHSSPVIDIYILKNERILSHSHDNTLRIWSFEGESLAVLKGHNSSIKKVKILEDEKILSYADDNTLILWSPEGDILTIVNGYTSSIENVKILKDGNILSYSDNSTITIWNSIGEILTMIEKHIVYIKHTKTFKEKLLSYSENNTLTLWSFEGERLAILKGHNSAIKKVKTLEDEKILSYSDDNTLIVWSSEGEILTILNEYKNSIENVRILDDGRILSYSDDNTLALWNSRGKVLTILEKCIPRMNAIRILKTKETLLYSAKITGLLDNTYVLWNTEDKVLGILSWQNYYTRGVEVLQNNTILSYGNEDGILVVNSLDGAQITVLEGHNDCITGVEVLEDGRILSYSQDETLIIWSSEGEKIVEISDVDDMQILENGNIITYNFEDNNSTLWDFKGNELAIIYNSIDSMRLLDDRKILSISYYDDLIVWNFEGEELATIDHRLYRIDIDSIESIKIFDEQKTLSNTNENTLVIKSFEGKKIILTYNKLEHIKILEDRKVISCVNDFTSILFSCEGEQLATFDSDLDEIKILDDGRILSYSGNSILTLWTSEGKEIAFIELTFVAIDKAKNLENGKILLYTAPMLVPRIFNRLILWNPKNNSLTTLDGHTDSINGIEILEDGRILSYSDDCSIRLWSSEVEDLTFLEKQQNNVTILKDGNKIEQLDDGRVLVLDPDEVDNVIISELYCNLIEGAEILEDGKILSYAEGDDDMILSHSNGDILAILTGRRHSIKGIEILENGQVLYCTKENTRLRVWEADKEETVLGGNVPKISFDKAIENSIAQVIEARKESLEEDSLNRLANAIKKTLINTFREPENDNANILPLEQEYEEHQKFQNLKIDTLGDKKYTGYKDCMNVIEAKKIHLNILPVNNTIRILSADDNLLGLLNVPIENIVFHNFYQNSLIASVNKSLLIYDYCNGNKSITIDEVTKILEESLHKKIN